MQKLYLVRHTAPRVAPGVCYGQLDVEVADTFEEEAQHVRRWLPPVELVLASPLRRTQRLAAHLARIHGCELRNDARLMEKHFGAWEGKAWDEIARSEIDAWAADVIGYAPPGGESALQLMQRVEGALHDIAQLPQRDIAIVAHAGSIRALLALLAGIPLAHTLAWGIEFGGVIGARIG